MNDEAVYRTAPATPGLLNIVNFKHFSVSIIVILYTGSILWSRAIYGFVGLTSFIEFG